jgi:hypothetical protein
MHIEYFHPSKFGNGAQVAQEFAWQMSDRGVDVGLPPCRPARVDRPR